VIYYRVIRGALKNYVLEKYAHVIQGKRKRKKNALISFIKLAINHPHLSASFFPFKVGGDISLIDHDITVRYTVGLSLAVEENGGCFLRGVYFPR